MDFLSDWSPLRWRVILVEVGHHSLVPASLLWAERATNEVQKYNSVHDPSALPPPPSHPSLLPHPEGGKVVRLPVLSPKKSVSLSIRWPPQSLLHTRVNLSLVAEIPLF